MPLTKRQREQLKETEAIANLTQLAYQRIEEADAEARNILLKIAINKMVIAEIVTRYTLLDEMLSVIIAHYYSGRKQGRLPLQIMANAKNFADLRALYS